jgi:hypothetical protein
MAAIADNLIADESIVFQSKKHWWAPVRASLVAGLMVIGALLIRAISPSGDGIFGWVGGVMDLIAIGLLVVGLGWIVYNIVAWRTAEFAVTNRRVLREEGLVQHRSSSTLLTSLSDIRSSVGAVGGALGFGDLVLLTTSGSAGEDRFTCITKPIEFRNAVMTQKMASDAGSAAAPAQAAPAQAAPTQMAPATATAPAANATAPGAAPAAAAVPANDDAATLMRLAELRDSGAISPAEYEAKKAEILARM